MIGRPGGGARVTLVSVAIVLVGIGAWLAWPRSVSPTRGAAVVAVTPSAVLAEETLDRFERFRIGPAGGTLALGDAELGSVLRFALPGLLPAGVSEPSVFLVADRVTLSARVATAAFPELPVLEPVIGMLPDTVGVRLEGALGQFGRRSLAFRVSRLEAGNIPLPDRLVPEVLDALGRTDRGGLPRNALHVPLPTGIDSVFVERDSLFLVGGR